MDKRELLKRIDEGEGLFQEFKTSLEKVDRTIVAFANAKGGVIYLGVSDSGKILSFPLSNNLKARIHDIARNLDPSISVDCISLGKIAAIVVKEGEDKPYKCSDGFFLRVGATNQKLTRDEMLSMALKAGSIRYEALQETAFDYRRDFSAAAFEKFVRGAGLGVTFEAMGQEDFIISLGVAERQRGGLIFNHAGVLFFADNPQRFIPQAKLSYARYQGTSKSHVVDRAIFSGPLQDQLEGACRRLAFDIPVGYRLADRATREEAPHYPLRAVEEALVNAVIHRDYSEAGAEIAVDHYADRIEISNPGEALGNVNIENLGRKAFRRNPLIAELFYRIGRGEKLGSGITRIRTLMDEWRLKAPVFDVSGGFFSITFIGPRAPVAEEKLALLPARPRQFVESRNQIEELFPAIVYAEMLHVTPRTAQKDLDALIKSGIIKKEGRGKNTRYRFC